MKGKVGVAIRDNLIGVSEILLEAVLLWHKGQLFPVGSAVFRDDLVCIAEKIQHRHNEALPLMGSVDLTNQFEFRGTKILRFINK